MFIRAINALMSLPGLAQISNLTSRVKNVIQKNKEATEDAKTIALITATGTSFGLLGRSVVGVGTNNSSLKATLIWGAIGALASTLASTPMIYRFVSNFNARESGIK